MSDQTITVETVTIRQALADDAWEGHDETLTAADLDAIVDVVAKAAIAITTGQSEAFPPAHADDTAWVAGWHSATKHVSHALATKPDLIRAALSNDAWEGHDETLTAADLDAIAQITTKAVAAIAAKQYDAFLDSPSLHLGWITGWQCAVLHATTVLTMQGTLAN